MDNNKPNPLGSGIQGIYEGGQGKAELGRERNREEG